MNTPETDQSQPCGGEGWRDIESAPKDGTPILSTNRHGAVVIICWWPHAHYDVNADSRGEFTGAWDDGERDEFGDFEPFSPRYWMPLPAAPGAAALHPPGQGEGERLQRELEREEASHENTIDQRDRAEKAADTLAALIARMTGVQIGEHSNVNCPWEKAAEAAEEALAETPQPLPGEGVEELRGLSEKATQGEWTAEEAVDLNGYETGKLWLIMGAQPMAYDFDRVEDAKFAAAAVNYVRTALQGGGSGE